MEDNKEVSKKNIWIIAAAGIAVIAIIAAVLIFNDSLFKQKETVKNDIVIKRIDGGDSLKMPYRYANIFFTKSSFLAKEEILNLIISTASFDIVEAGISWGGAENVLVNMGDKNVMDDLGGIKYCKGITDVSTIMTDKRRSSVVFYEGYSEEQFNDSKGYVIIPSSMSKYINKELPADEKLLSLRSPSYFNMYTIIGEYTTKDEYDTIYVSYTGFERLFAADSIYISEYVETCEMDINEEKDLTNLMEFLEKYFADANKVDEYEGRLNGFDEPYRYEFIHSISVNLKPSEMPSETMAEPSPDQSGQPAIMNENNILTISRIDGGTDLNMSYVYADMLINHYKEYSQYIDDIVISTGLKGVDMDSVPIFTNVEPYGMDIVWSVTREEIKDWQLFADIMFHQSVTGTSEIISNKSDCEIKFYGDYTEMDLTMPREEDCKNMIKGYAIVPTTCNDAFVGYNEGESGLTVTYSSRERDEKSNVPLIMPIFKVIGEYVTTDRYDTVYLTYKGYNEKYIIEEFKSEYIESIVIETKKDIDIRPFLEYIESLFAPADNAGEYADKNNILDIPYEFCYTMTKEME